MNLASRLTVLEQRSRSRSVAASNGALEELCARLERLSAYSEETGEPTAEDRARWRREASRWEGTGLGDLLLRLASEGEAL